MGGEEREELYEEESLNVARCEGEKGGKKKKWVKK